MPIKFNILIVILKIVICKVLNKFCISYRISNLINILNSE